MSKLLTLFPVATVALVLVALFSATPVPGGPIHIQCQPGATPPYTLTCTPPPDPNA
jgi:hypothetical protein